MKNNILLKLIIIALLFGFTTGCLKRDNMEDINIITTSYPLEYILTKLYGENSVINSIYPDGVDINNYKLTEKKYKDLSKQDLFVYNGLSNDKEIALNLLNRNKNILIMDSNLGMEYTYGIEELWLNPSNLLMISQNIKNGLQEIISSKYIIDEINNQYENLKLELSELDADIKNIIQESKKTTLITSSPSLQFLSKYGLKTIYINDDKSLTDAIVAIKTEDIKYIYILENDNESEYLKKITNQTDINIITIDKIDNLTDEERDKKENYVTIMNENIELIRKGLE
ncbi:MAG: metal ABC transporter substrate-binding protein [bacterium]|nr:metal ABC transporter substrate-binding protein [bacterium]